MPDVQSQFSSKLQISDVASEFPHFPTPLPVELQLWRQRCLEGRSPKPPQERNFGAQMEGLTDFTSKFVVQISTANIRQTNRIWDCLALPDNVLLPKIKIT